MKTKKPQKLLYQGDVVAELIEFGYEFPWACAKAKFYDKQLFDKLESLSLLNKYLYELEEMGVSNDVEEILWEKKRCELGLSLEDLKLDSDELWAVICDDGTVDSVFSLSYEDNWLEWRA